MPKTNLPSTYKTLFQKVKQTLILGQQRIEAEKVKVYWETGRLIHAHVLKHADRAEYGAEVVLRLAKDLNVDRTVLNRCVRFAEKYPRLPIGAGRHQFTWSHYRKLITIADDQERLLIEEKAGRNGWSAEELETRVKTRKFNGAPVEKETPPSQTLLTSARGQLYTYRLVHRPQLGAGKDERVWLLDLGFSVYKRLSARAVAKFEADEIVESAFDPATDRYSLKRSERGTKDLFTYAAVIERVVDADTLKVRVDLGFRLEHTETLRLRDIDAPELGTKEGDAAKVFVQSLLKESALIVMRSSRPDKYARYLADVFIPQGEAPAPASDVYLNNLLLEEGHARRV
ncbi:MAG: DUF1016 N-terminal domain-containing protein [Candidatus Omnitrophota bacterium]